MEQFGIQFGEKLRLFLTWLSNPVTQLVFFPLLGVAFIALTPARRQRLIKLWAVLAAGLSALSALFMITGLPKAIRDLTFTYGPGLAWQFDFQPFAQYIKFEPQLLDPQFAQDYKWIAIMGSVVESFSVNYQVGIDGLSMPLVIMSAIIVLMAVIWALPRTERVREFFAFTLLLETGLLGVFVALDFILFYLFWELMLIPMYFLIAGWGKNPAAAGKAAIKFFIYTVAGSVFMLISFITMKVFAGEAVYSFSMLDIIDSSYTGGLAIVWPEWRILMFVGLLLGFAVKVPMFPFHTWLPDAHTEAPTEMSVILAAVMLKTGAYGYLRILYPAFPDVAYVFGPIIACCGVIAIVYGAAVTLVQTDIKRMVAYSSISHMGFIVLGISAQNPDATVGAIYQMVAHGVIISALFFLCGVIERRYGTRDLRDLAAMWKLAPGYAFILAVAAFAGMGLPGLAAFWGEFMVLKGTYVNSPVWQSVQVGAIDASRFLQIMAVLAAVGIVISAVYMINMLQRVLPGEPKAGTEPWRGIRFTDGVALIPLFAAMVLMGIYPRPIIDACINYANMLWAMQLSK